MLVRDRMGVGQSGSGQIAGSLRAPNSFIDKPSNNVRATVAVSRQVLQPVEIPASPLWQAECRLGRIGHGNQLLTRRIPNASQLGCIAAQDGAARPFWGRAVDGDQPGPCGYVPAGPAPDFSVAAPIAPQSPAAGLDA